MHAFSTTSRNHVYHPLTLYLPTVPGRYQRIDVPDATRAISLVLPAKAPPRVIPVWKRTIWRPRSMVNATRGMGSRAVKMRKAGTGWDWPAARVRRGRDATWARRWRQWRSYRVGGATASVRSRFSTARLTKSLPTRTRASVMRKGISRSTQRTLSARQSGDTRALSGTYRGPVRPLFTAPRYIPSSHLIFPLSTSGYPLIEPHTSLKSAPARPARTDTSGRS
jgi:hypothetical protein